VGFEPVALANAPVALLPVATFLAALLAFDSYKLVRFRTLLALIAAGALAALAAWAINRSAIDALDLDLPRFSRYVAPVLEEILKGSIVVVLLRAQRIGFPVDAAIAGFAVGTGFALAENAYYLGVLTHADLGTWILRGFGTAIMHGGATAIFAIAALVLADRRGRADLQACLPGLAIAVLVHSAYNHFFGSPAWSAVGVLVVLPALLVYVFVRSERAVEAWLGAGFDADTELLELINSGQLSTSPVGQWLTTLKRRFRGEVVADVLCYLRLHVELGLRAKGLLMLRDEGLDVPIDEHTRDKLEELRWLERSIGPTALLAIRPFRHMRRKDLWQLYVLGR
jgi:RsiW-degrading membrane proteinase PrsW (M82 family)